LLAMRLITVWMNSKCLSFVSIEFPVLSACTGLRGS
jgi:hypothetical protein